MQRDGRRVLLSPDRVRQLFAKVRRELHEMGERHAAEVAALRAELDEVRALYTELRAASLARQRAHAAVVGLYRERSIQRAQAAERDPAAALN